MILNKERFSYVRQITATSKGDVRTERFTYSAPGAVYDIVISPDVTIFGKNSTPCAPTKMHRQIVKHFFSK
jgi:hypothetical protein